MRTPLRDELGLNDTDALALAAEGSRREMRNREAMEKNSLRAGLASLPAPRVQYQIVAPEVRVHCKAILASTEMCISGCFGTAIRKGFDCP